MKYLSKFLSVPVMLAMFSVATAEVVATVEGDTISAEMIDAVAQARLQKNADALTEQERAQLTEELIQLFVLSSAAEKKKLQKDPEVAMQLDLQRRTLLAQKMVQQYLEANPATDTEIQQAYDAQFGSAQTEYKARHILLETSDQAQGVIAQLDGGADFAALATERSTGPSAANGGDLGWFAAAQMVKPFSDAVAALDNGTYSRTPVQTQFGWHVILKEDQRQVPPPALDSVRQGIERQLMQQKIGSFMSEMRNSAKIDRK